MQVPEGLYRIESLNPNSMFYLALRVDYPNQFDKAKAKRDGRKNLGSDIMIHGKNGSIGCLAMGDQAAEELFILAAETGIDNISVILSPVDFWKRDLPLQMPEVPEWIDQLYTSIKTELTKLK
jgi:murein L,D-transpeptidase YafK